MPASASPSADWRAPLSSSHQPPPPPANESRPLLLPHFVPGVVPPFRNMRLLAANHVDGDRPTLLSSARYALTFSTVNVLLAFVPLGLLAKLLGWSETAIFALNFLAVIPLAKLLGMATEELSLHVGQTMGGLLNATFGNAVEFLVALFALKDGLVDVVQASLLGSILSNLLLVLGCCFAFGGLKFHEQTFNATGAQTNCSLLTLSVLSLLLPAAFRATVADEYYPAIIPISHGAAVTMLVVYVLFLIFELKTHKDLFSSEFEIEGAENMTATAAALLLLSVTLVVALCAEYLVGSIEGVAKAAGLTKAFIGLVLLPIVGNAAEHVTAITSALHNNINLSIAIAVGSSIQIALLLTPAMVVFGWIIGTEFTLFFNVYETSVLFVSVMVTNTLLVDGKSNWLEGVLLISVYAIIALSFFYFPDA